MKGKPRSITINNVSQNDADKYQVRIVMAHKYLFPSEKPGEPQVFTLHVRIGKQDYEVDYKIGSQDGKERSGILRLGSQLFRDVLKLNKNSKLKISKSNEGVYFLKKV